MIDMEGVLTYIRDDKTDRLIGYLMEHRAEWMAHPDRATVESYIASDPELSVDYVNVINGRFELGEPAIAKSHMWAYVYSCRVFKHRWPEAEPTIAKDPIYAYYYAKDIIKGRWPEAEPVIAKNPWFAYLYAYEVVKGRFQLGEPAIMSDPIAADHYKANVLGGKAAR